MQEPKQVLLDEIFVLKAGYIASLNNLDVMENWGKAQLEALYSTRIGRFKVELMEMELELKSFKKKTQLSNFMPK